ncbi:MAG TPA: 2-hydroxy-3-oxopropionate reductase, partial [Gammaproteobacteria bacterium]|nr:2-hydroxy-3-oxopropionate reductase [Gammaproteobacteria bacterium]
MNKQQNIGFIGLGVMGEPMCRNLSTKSGVKIVAFDRREEPLTRLSMVGVSRAASLAEMADSDVVFLSLPDGEAVQEVCLGNTGLITVLNSGAIVV